MSYKKKLGLYILSTLCILCCAVVGGLGYAESITAEQKIETLIHDKNYSGARTVLYSYLSERFSNETGFSTNDSGFLSMLEYGSIAFSSGHSYKKMNTLKSRLASTTSYKTKSYYLLNIGHIYFERFDKLSDDMERGVIKEDNITIFLALFNAKKALAAYSESLLYNPDNIDAMMHKGVLIIDIRGDTSSQAKESKKLFNKVLKIDPLNHLAWYRLGNILFSEENYEGALSYFKKSIEIYPYHDRARNNKGNAEGRLGMHEEAIKSYTKAIEVYNPNFNPRGGALQNMKASSLYNRGAEYFILGDMKKSEADIRAAIQENPLHSKAREFLKENF